MLVTGSLVLGALFAMLVQNRKNTGKKTRKPVRNYNFSANPHGTDYFFSGEEESIDLAVVKTKSTDPVI